MNPGIIAMEHTTTVAKAKGINLARPLIHGIARNMHRATHDIDALRHSKNLTLMGMYINLL